jgi:hypothetical protein
MKNALTFQGDGKDWGSAGVPPVVFGVPAEYSLPVVAAFGHHLYAALCSKRAP